MAPRAYCKGYLKLSLVSWPISVFPARSEREKISFHQLNKKTGNRIKIKCRSRQPPRDFADRYSREKSIQALSSPLTVSQLTNGRFSVVVT